MPKFNNRGDELCNEGNGHEFEGGLCAHCLAPETEKDTDRAINAVDNMQALENRFSEVLGRYLNHDDAVFEAHRSHRSQ